MSKTSFRKTLIASALMGVFLTPLHQCALAKTLQNSTTQNGYTPAESLTDSISLNLPQETYTGPFDSVYDGTNTALLEGVIQVNGSGSKIYDSFVPNRSDPNTSKAVKMTSLDNVNGLIYANYSTSRTSNTSNENLLLIDLNNRVQGSASATITGLDVYSLMPLHGVAAVGLYQGGANQNTTVIQNSDITINAQDLRTGWNVAAVNIEYLAADASGNTMIVDNVKISDNYSPIEDSATKISFGAVTSRLDDGGTNKKTLNGNTVWVRNSELDVNAIYGVYLYNVQNTVADGNSVYIEGSVLKVNAVADGNQTTGIYAVSSSNTATGNWLEISDTEITVSKNTTTPYQIYSVGSVEQAQNNTTIVRDSSITSATTIYFSGASANVVSGATLASGNRVFIGSTNAQDRMKINYTEADASTYIFGGRVYSTDQNTQVTAADNLISIENLEINNKTLLYSGYVWGAGANGEARGNTIQITNSVFDGMTQIYAGRINHYTGSGKASGAVKENKIVISQSQFQDLELIAGQTYDGLASGNVVSIENSVINGGPKGIVICGGRSDVAGSASDNIINIAETKLANGAMIFGGYGPSATNNIVTIGTNVTSLDGGRASFTMLSGAGGTGMLDGNELVTASAFDVQTLNGFQHFKFLTTQEQLDSGALIKVTGSSPVVLQPSGNTQSTVAVGGTGINLAVGTTYTLIDSNVGFEDLDGNKLTAAVDLNGMKRDLTIEENTSLVRITTNEISKDSYDLVLDETGKNLNMTITDKSSSTDMLNPETDVLMQASIASVASLFAADDLLVDTALKSRNNQRLSGPFVAARAGTYSHDASSRFDTDVYSGLLGFALHASDVEFGPFIEMGRSNYEMHQGASGHHNYAGVGVYANWQTPFYVRLTGYLKGGAIENNFSTTLVGQSVDFDKTSAYWGAHVGVNADFSVTEKLRARPFVSYFYDGRESESFTQHGSVVDGAKFDFDTINAHRVQVGSMFEYAHTETTRPYFGITYEQVIKAEAEGTVRDSQGNLSLNSSDIEGGTGIVSAGWSYLNDMKDFEFNFGVNGYAGARNGVSAQMNANWKF